MGVEHVKPRFRFPPSDVQVTVGKTIGLSCLLKRATTSFALLSILICLFIAAESRAEEPIEQAIRAQDFKRARALVKADPSLLKRKFDYAKMTLLHLAAAYDRAQDVKFLIDLGADVNALDREESTPLHYSVSAETSAALRLLLDAKANVNAKTKSGATPLHLAVSRRATAAAKLLLEHGADPNFADVRGRSPLQIAVEFRDADIIKLLIAHKADRKRADKRGRLPFEIAMSHYKDNLAAILLPDDYDVNTKDDRGYPLLRRACNHNNLDLVKVLIARKVDLNATTRHGAALHLAAELGNTTLAKMLLDAGADVNVKGRHGRTPLFDAASSGGFEMVKLLLARGADIDAKNDFGESLIHSAAFSGNVELVRMLLKRGADVNAKGNIGRTPLHAASGSRLDKDGKVALLLLDAGANPAAKTTNGSLPIHGAANIEKIALVKRLIKEGSPADPVDKSGETPLHNAAHRGNALLVKYLLKAGAKPNPVEDRESPLHVAVQYGRKNKEVVQLLLDAGADVNAKDSRGTTPIQLASKEFVELLKARGAKEDIFVAIRHKKIDLARKILKEDPTQANAVGAYKSTPLHGAVYEDYTELVKLLLDTGAKPNVQDSLGRTPLHLVVNRGVRRRKIFEMLMAAGADPTIRDRDGRPAIPAGTRTDAASGARSTYLWHGAAIGRIAFSPDGTRVAIAGHSTWISVWDVVTGERKLTIEGKLGSVYGLAWSPDGKWIASTDVKNSVSLWDAVTGKHVKRLAPHSNQIRGIAFSTDSVLLASAVRGRSPRIWDVRTGKPLDEPSKREYATGRAHFSGDGLFLVWGTGRRIIAWDLLAGQEAQRIELPRGGRLLAVSPDGRLGAVASYGSIELWELSSGKFVRRLDVNLATNSTAFFSPDGRLLAFSGQDKNYNNRIEIRDTVTGKLELVLPAMAAFSPDGRRVAYVPVKGDSELSGSARDHTVVIRELSDAFRKRPAASTQPAQAKLDSLWQTLGGDDAPAAHQAMGALTSDEDAAVKFLAGKLGGGLDRFKTIRRLVKDLDHEDWNVRENASGELAKAGNDAILELREALRRNPSLEVRNRASKIFKTIDSPKLVLTGERLRRVRVLAVLEWIGTDAAHKLLEKRAVGSPSARIRSLARAAAQRLKIRERSPKTGQPDAKLAREIEQPVPDRAAQPDQGETSSLPRRKGKVVYAESFEDGSTGGWTHGTTVATRDLAGSAFAIQGALTDDGGFVNAGFGPAVVRVTAKTMLAFRYYTEQSSLVYFRASVTDAKRKRINMAFWSPGGKWQWARMPLLVHPAKEGDTVTDLLVWVRNEGDKTPVLKVDDFVVFEDEQQPVKTPSATKTRQPRALLSNDFEDRRCVEWSRAKVIATAAPGGGKFALMATKLGGRLRASTQWLRMRLGAKTTVELSVLRKKAGRVSVEVSTRRGGAWRRRQQYADVKAGTWTVLRIPITGGKRASDKGPVAGDELVRVTVSTSSAGLRQAGGLLIDHFRITDAASRPEEWLPPKPSGEKSKPPDSDEF